MKRVIVGLSGGVDSSVTAYLLKEQGYEVIGLFMKNWHDDSVTISNECPWLEDSNDALIVAEKLGIPFQVVDLSEQYKERIVDYMFDEYEKGRTPNPDILCNREIKFDVFMDIALNLGADYVATGHYCRKEEEIIDGQSVYKLIAGKDVNKDQSYFLCQLSQQQLAKALFPIGQLTKPEVREIATKAGLVTADKKDSQGLCFIGKVRLPEFLQQKLAPKEGKIIQIDNSSEIYQRQVPVFSSKEEELEFFATKFRYQQENGKVVGKHQGAHFFTKGQRKGLAVGGTKEPLFVIETDNRDELLQFLKRKEIFCGIHYPIPLHLQGVYRELGYKAGDFPVSERSASRILSLPIYPELKKEEIYYIKNAINEFVPITTSLPLASIT